MIEREFEALRVGDALRHVSDVGLYTVVRKNDGSVHVRTGETPIERQVHHDNYTDWHVYMKIELA